MGGSLLPSESQETLASIFAGKVTLRVIPNDEFDTYFLTATHEEFPNHKSILAAHPNSFSLHELAKRMVKAAEFGAAHPPWIERMMAQRAFIETCGGIAKPEQTFSYYIEEMA